MNRRYTIEVTEPQLRLIEQVTGDRPDTCPWQAFYDPVVIDVLGAYKFFESGQLAFYLGDDAPNHLVEGLSHYHSALNRAKAWKYEQDRLERDRKREVRRG